jgi:hypothetical protein
MRVLLVMVRVPPNTSKPPPYAMFVPKAVVLMRVVSVMVRVPPGHEQAAAVRARPGGGGVDEGGVGDGEGTTSHVQAAAVRG